MPERNSFHHPEATYGKRLVESYHEFRGGIDNEVDDSLDKIETSAERQRKAAAMGSFATEQATARAFFDVMIRPFVLKGTLSRYSKEKTFAPNQAYVNDFASQILENGIVSQLYIRLLQSRPGQEQNDSRVSYGSLELLRTWSVRAKAAKKLGLDYSVNIVDETGAFDHGDQLGFTQGALDDSYDAMSQLIGDYDCESELRIMPFSHQASLYRGDDGGENLSQEYEHFLESNIARTVEDVQLGVYSLNAIRAVMIHRLRHGDSFANVSANQDLEYLNDFSKDDVDETLLVSESFTSAMQMRPSARAHVEKAGLQGEFPEFFDVATVMHWGISKKPDRLSIQPNFKVYKGRLFTPGYALPVYDGNRQFLGLNGYAELSNSEFDTIKGPNDLPAALIKNE